ncbi:hypothetical protein AVEN_97815-1 [Araneus ventricosus]|uniref:Uncharacterized protein n=1 Tax=Araneus ventricosus TaxID=182803 RepID=A0A4Y2K5L5_ARAVE|nr:hypothetical protein AVEN_97815-1 [Araneus ventricosus]
MTWTTLELPPNLQTSTPHQREDFRPTTSDFTCIRPKYMADLQWKWVSNLEPSVPKAETLPLGHRGPYSQVYAYPWEYAVVGNL